MSPSSRARSVLVTGAAGGIGAATVHALTERGYVVYASVRATGDPAVPAGTGLVPMDVTDPASVRSAAKQVERDTHGDGLHAVVNNAGVIVQGRLELVPPNDLRRQFAVNTLGPIHVTQAFLPLLRTGAGRIINISAPTAHLPAPFLAPIAASKAALNSLSDALRLELAGWGIPVSVVEPSTTTTQIFAKARDAAQAALDDADPDHVRLYSQHVAAVEQATANQRSNPPETVAEVIVRAVEVARPKRWYAAGRDARLVGALSRLPAGIRDALVTRTLGLSGVEATAGP